MLTKSDFKNYDIPLLILMDFYVTFPLFLDTRIRIQIRLSGFKKRIRILPNETDPS